MKRGADGHFKCNLCNYVTTKLTNYTRHTQSDAHKRRCEFLGANVRNALTENCDFQEHANVHVPDEDFGFESTSKDDTCHDEACFDYESDHEGLGEPGIREETSLHRENLNENAWFPFSTKRDMLLYILLHSKTHTLSDETAKFVWFIMQECGITMPSFTSIKDLKFGDLTPESLLQQSETKDGRPFWMVKPSALVKLGISHPQTANQLIRYGRFSDDIVITEQADGSKFKSIQQHSARLGETIFFTDDFAVDMISNTIGRIRNFLQFKENNQIHAQFEPFERVGNSSNRLIVPSDAGNNFRLIELKFLKQCEPEKLKFYSYDDEQVSLEPLGQDELRNKIPTNPFKGKYDVQHVPVNVFMDDTSSNKSKKWKPLHCIQLQLAGIPVELRQRQINAKFVSASSDVSILDMMKTVVDDLQHAKEDGLLAYDAKERRVVVVTTELSLCVCDFNMLAEAANHMGANTTQFCPRCHAEKSNQSFQKGRMRTPAESKRILNRLAIIDNKELRQRYGLKYYDNCLWDIIDPHSDIPVGILHWLYLGLGKHLLKACIGDLTEPAKQHLQLLLENADQSSFPFKMSSDIIRHVESRQGKDIKHYLQLAPYHMKIVGLPDEKVKLVCKLAEISSLIQKTAYDTDELQCLKTKIYQYLECLKIVYPSLLQKVKTHLSTHLLDDIEKHGPPLAYTEDVFEKMHGGIRDQIFLQNQHATSRDTALAFAEMEILSHVITGGFFSVDNKWVQADDMVQQMACRKEVLSFLGQSGEVTKKEPALMKANRSVTRKIEIRQEDGRSVATYRASRCLNGDVVNVGNAVVFSDEIDSDLEHIGIFKEGKQVVCSDGREELVEIQVFRKVAPAQNLGFVSERILLLDEFVQISPRRLMQKACIVHDCINGGCHKKECTQTVRVEQQLKDMKKLIWYHSPRDKFFYFNRFRHSNENVKLS